MITSSRILYPVLRAYSTIFQFNSLWLHKIAVEKPQIVDKQMLFYPDLRQLIRIATQDPVHSTPLEISVPTAQQDWEPDT